MDKCYILDGTIEDQEKALKMLLGLSENDSLDDYFEDDESEE